MPDPNPDSTVLAAASAPCAGCLSRRQFLAQSALTMATVAVVAACGNGQIGPTAVTVPNNNGGHAAVITVGKFAALATVGTLVQINNYLVVKRLGATSFTAFSMVCTHQGCLTMLESNAFYCPCHGSIFDSNGRATSGPATVPLQQYATSYDPTTDQLTIG
jgi:cytochrome b6-f complex iron-sulfur subunit